MESMSKPRPKTLAQQYPAEHEAYRNMKKTVPLHRRNQILRLRRQTVGHVESQLDAGEQNCIPEFSLPALTREKAAKFRCGGQ